MTQSPFAWVGINGKLAAVLLRNVHVLGVQSRYYLNSDIRHSVKLGGTVCVYLIMAIAFGGVFELVCIADPSVMAHGIPLSTAHFMESINFSLLMLGGLDIPYDCAKLIWNIGALESIWGSLFIVFVVGRMLYK